MALSFTPDPVPSKLSFVPDGGEVLPDVANAAGGPSSRGGSGRELARRNGSRPVNPQEFDAGTREIEATRHPEPWLDTLNNAAGHVNSAVVSGVRGFAGGIADAVQMLSGAPDNSGDPAERVGQWIDKNIRLPGMERVDQENAAAADAVAKGARKIGERAIGQPAYDTALDVGKTIARPVGDALALTGAGGAARGVAAAAGESAAVRAATASAPAETTAQVAQAAGFRIPPTVNPEAGAVARTAERLSDSRGLRHEDILHNQKISDDIAHNQEAGLKTKPGVPPTVEDWADAKAPHNKVYNKVANAIEPGVSSPQFAAEVADANGKGLFAGDDADVASKISKLTNGEPVDGQYLVNASRELRSRGYRYENSQDAVIQDRGTAYLKMADAIDDEMGRRLPAGGPVTIEDFKAARKSLAKVHEVQAATVGSHVDIARLARSDQRRPGVLDGGLKVLAQVGNDFPTVTGLASRHVEPTASMFGVHNVPAAVGAVMAAGGHLMSGGLTTVGLLGARYGLRRALTSGSGEASVLADNPRLARFFPKAEPPVPPSPLELKPSPGPVIEPHQPQLLRPDASGVTAAESSQVPQDSVRLVPPLGEAFEQHQPGLPFNEPVPPGTPPARGPGGAQTDLGLRLTTPAEDLPQLESTTKRAADKAAMDSTVQKLAGAKKRGVLKESGANVDENVQVSPFRDRHIMPGSTVISEGGTRAEPTRYISLTPQGDGSLRITGTHVTGESRGQGLGQKNILDAIDYGKSKGAQVNGDVSVTVDNLRALLKAKDKGTIDFDFRTPEIEAKARRMVKDNGKGKDGGVLKDGGNSVTQNWRRPSNLGDKLIGEK